MPDNLFLIVAYDITSNRRRNRVVKFLKDFGQRVNYSVFECPIKKEVYPKLRDGLKAMINPRKDSVLFYTLCLNCQQKREVLGVKQVTPLYNIINI